MPDCGVLDEGAVYSFGSNYYGCLGLSDDDVNDDDIEEVLVPTPISFFADKPVEQVCPQSSYLP